MRLVGLALWGVVFLVGCSISDSVSSSFESSASSLASSSSSESSSRERASYRNEVRDYTSAYVKSGGQFDNFTRGLDSIAAKHKVTNWEADQDTYVGIGAGLKAAGLNRTDFAVWQSNLSNGDATKAASMAKGYGE